MKKPRSADDPAASQRTAAPRSTEEVARELGAAAGAGHGAPDDEALREAGAITFDRSGALAGRPKLTPRKAHRPDTPVDQDASEATETAAERGPRKAALPPKRGARRPAGMPERAIAKAAAGEDDEVAIPAGSFLYGEGKQARELSR